MHLPNVNDYLGRTVSIQALRRPAGTVTTRAAQRERQAIRLAGIAWKITEIDVSRNRVVVHSEGNWTMSHCRLDTFMRYIASGDIVVD